MIKYISYFCKYINKNYIIMKTCNYLFLLALLMCITSCGVDNHDLGKLTYVRPSAGNSYCVYEITKIVEQPDGLGYSKGDIFCIKCCSDWPNGAGGSCDSPIEFETQDGAKYEAKIENLTNGTCMTCPQNVTDGYDCP